MEFIKPHPEKAVYVVDNKELYNAFKYLYCSGVQKIIYDKKKLDFENFLCNVPFVAKDNKAFRKKYAFMNC